MPLTIFDFSANFMNKFKLIAFYSNLCVALNYWCAELCVPLLTVSKVAEKDLNSKSVELMNQ